MNNANNSSLCAKHGVEDAPELVSVNIQKVRDKVFLVKTYAPSPGDAGSKINQNTLLEALQKLIAEDMLQASPKRSRS